MEKRPPVMTGASSCILAFALKKIVMHPVWLALVLCACALRPQQSDPLLLLEKVAAEHQRLDSADFSLHATFIGGDLGNIDNLTVSGNGSIADGGKRLGFSFESSLRLDEMPLTAAGDMVLEDGQMTYIRVKSLAADVGGVPLRLDLPQLEGYLNRWWLLPNGASPNNKKAEADPSLIALQLRALDIVSDEGTVNKDGKQLRQLHVRLNKQRMASFLETVSRQRGDEESGFSTSAYDATGKLWIDEQTSLLSAASWELSPRSSKEPKVTIDVGMGNPHNGKPILTPENPLPFLPGMSPFDALRNSVGDGSPASIPLNVQQ